MYIPDEKDRKKVPFYIKWWFPFIIFIIVFFIICITMSIFGTNSKAFDYIVIPTIVLFIGIALILRFYRLYYITDKIIQNNVDAYNSNRK